MKWPPYMMKVAIRNQRHGFAIWLPMFIIGPIFLIFLIAAFLVALPFVLLALLFTWQTDWWRPYFLAIPAFLRLVCNLPGLKVDVDGADGRVYVIFR